MSTQRKLCDICLSLPPGVKQSGGRIANINDVYKMVVHVFMQSFVSYIFTVDGFAKIKVYVGDIANPANGMTLDFPQLQECAYFEGPATDGGPHIFDCINTPLLGRHIVVTNIDTTLATLYLCEVIVCEYRTRKNGKYKNCTIT